MWEDDETEDFRDQPDEINQGSQAPPVHVRTAAPIQKPVAPIQSKPVVQDYDEEDLNVSEEEEEDFTEIMNDVDLRLDQGQLYKLVMNSNLFEGTDLNPKAVKNVQRQIRNFAKEQMEIMLGLRQEQQNTNNMFNGDFPFNSLEVETLKSIAYTATQGATSDPENPKYQGFKKTTLSPINTNKAPTKTITPVKAKEKVSLPARTQVPVKRKRNANIDQILNEEGVTLDQIDEVFDPNYKPLNKDVSQMTPDELNARNKRSKLTKQVGSTAALPMPAPDQINGMYEQIGNRAASSPQIQNIMAAVLKQSKK